MRRNLSEMEEVEYQELAYSMIKNGNAEVLTFRRVHEHLSQRLRSISKQTGRKIVDRTLLRIKNEDFEEVARLRQVVGECELKVRRKRNSTTQKSIERMQAALREAVGNCDPSAVQITEFLRKRAIALEVAQYRMECH